MSKQDRQGVRTPADLERKYRFGKQFENIFNVLKDIQHRLEILESAILPTSSNSSGPKDVEM